MHYYRLRETGEIGEAEPRRRGKRPCKVVDCANDAITRDDLCPTHRRRKRLYGDENGRFTLHREQADLADIVATAVDRLHEAAARAGCTLSVATDHAIGTWDRSRIDQIVTNLVSNSIRYAAGSPIAVTVERRAHDAVIEVRDQGPGLPDGQIARMFERFERGASMRHYAGLGLGLYVVRQITEAHGGQVTAENAAGGGACFTVRLPLDSSSGSTPHDLVA